MLLAGFGLCPGGHTKISWGVSQAGEGEVAIDPEYRRLSRARHQAAATKTRLMRVIEDPRSGTVARSLAPIQIQIGKRKACSVLALFSAAAYRQVHACAGLTLGMHRHARIDAFSP